MKESARKSAETSNGSNEASSQPTVMAKVSQASHAASTPAVNLESKAREAALESFVSDVKDRFEKRFPGIAYDSPRYDFRRPSGQTDSKGQGLTWQQVHQTKFQRSSPNLIEEKLTSLHPSFARAARALLANQVLLNRGKSNQGLEYGLSFLSHLAPPSEQPVSLKHLQELTVQDLKHIERCVLTTCLTQETAKALQRDKLSVDHLIVPGLQMRGIAARNSRDWLLALYQVIAVLQKAKVINPMHARLSHEISDLLIAIGKQQQQAFRKSKAQELEPGIAALSDAITAMADGDPRLSKIQEGVLSVMGLEMCAPSRINEVLAMSIHDRLCAVDAYEQEPGEEGGSATVTEAKVLYRAHAGIKEASTPNALDTVPNTVLMKGSKGAAWGAKPLLDFMLVMFNWCFDHLIEMGARSRMLLQHYEKHPTTLYLPPELEHLRGKPLTRLQIGRIMLLDADLGVDEETFKVKAYAATIAGQLVQGVLRQSGLMFTLAERPELADQIVDERSGFREALARKSPAPSTSRSKTNVQKTRKFEKNNRPKTLYAEWSSVETELLRRVHETIGSIRWVTNTTQYKGRLSNMLMLFDHIGRTPAYLPGALSAKDIQKRVKPNALGRESTSIQTVFEALDLKMPMLSKDGTNVEIVPAYCRSHDPRRWLTTMALRHSGPELSRLLINLWANRLDVTQLKAYDYLSPEEKVALTAQDVPQGMALVNEQDDLSAVLKEELTSAYKLMTQSVGVGLHAIRVTTMDAIHAAENNHPVAKVGDKLIVVFPTPYGICLHQHHEAGCTNYRGCGGACSDHRVIKGHLPTNEQVRKQADKLLDVIVAQVRRLILARNRRVVHDLDKLDEHLGRMIQQHMDAEGIASRLIADFHEIKDLIKDAAFKADLEDAYAFNGKVKQLDDPKVNSGAVIRYYNPERHGRPETERTLEALGGRNALEQEVKTFLEERDYMRLENRASNETEFKDEVGENVNEDDSDDEDAA